MDCKTIQKMILPFDHERLSTKEEEIFIQHIENCDDCKEELEIHYIVSYGLSDDDENIKVKQEYKPFINSYDFKGFVDKKIKNSKKKIERIHKMDEFMNLCIFGSDFCIIMILAMYVIIRYY